MTPAARDFVVITCEHGGNRIPARYAPLFRGWQRVLATHRGYDIGALATARVLARAFAAPLVVSTVSRLLVDLNRSIGNPDAWSDATRPLPAAEHAHIVRAYYAPYRERMDAIVTAAIARGRRVVHVSSHSFTPVLDGDVRYADVGLLYDPARAGEKALAAQWRAALLHQAPHLRVRRNYPYLGKGDGHPTSLRRRYPSRSYVGIELECNQAIATAGATAMRALRRDLVASLRHALQ